MQELYAFPGRDAATGRTEDELRELEDDLIDLEPVLHDTVVLALPFQPLCRDDCPGCAPSAGRGWRTTRATRTRAPTRGGRRAGAAAGPRPSPTGPTEHRDASPPTRGRLTVAVPKRKMSRSNTRSRRSPVEGDPDDADHPRRGRRGRLPRPHQARVVTDSAGTPLYLEYKGRRSQDV